MMFALGCVSETSNISAGVRRVGLCAWGMPLLVAVVLTMVVSAGPAYGEKLDKRSIRVSTAQDGQAGSGPRARIKEADFQFGEVWDGDKVEHLFEITNVGDEVLEIISVRASCGCTATEYTSQIAPGSTGGVKAIFNTRGKGTKTRSRVYVQTNDPRNARLTFTLKGTVKKAVEIEPMSGANFGRVVQEKVEPKKVTIRSNVSQPLKLTFAGGQVNDAFVVDVVEVDPGKVFELTVTPQLPLAEGSTTTRLIFDTGVEAVPQVTVLCRMFVPSDLEYTPPVINISAPVARETSRPIEFTFNPEETFEIGAAECTDPRIAVRIEDVIPGKRIRVVCVIPKGYVAKENEDVKVRVLTNYVLKPVVEIPVIVRTPTYHQSSKHPGAKILVGSRAPSLDLRATDGSRFRFSPGQSQVMVVDFWSTLCSHSRRQLAMVQRLGEAYGKRGVGFTLINVDKQAVPSQVVAQVEALGITLPVLLDSRGTASALYSRPVLPTLILIGSDGTVEAVHEGDGGDGEGLARLEQQVRSQLDLLLAGKKRGDFPALPAAKGSGEQTADGKDVSPATLVLPVGRQETGKHKPNAAVKTRIYYSNTGQSDLTITSINAAEPVKILPNYPKTIKSKKTGIAEVEFTAPSKPGTFSFDVLVSGDDARNATHVVVLGGVVRPYIEVTPHGGLDFTRNPDAHTRPRVARLTYNGAGKIEYLKAESTSPRFSASLAPIENTSDANLTVQANPPFDVGENDARIRVTTNCPEQPTIEVPVTLFMPQRIELLPSSISLIDVPRVRKGMVTIRNHGSGSLHILGVASSNKDIVTQLTSKPESNSYQLVVTLPESFVPSPDGDRVTLSTDDSEFGEIVIPVEVRAIRSPRPRN